MAPKRPSPLEEPPSASSSSEEVESEDITDNEEDQKQLQLDKANQELEDDEEEDSEEDEENKNLFVQQPQSPSHSDSKIHSGDALPSPTASDFIIKPSVSKPLGDSTKLKKTTSKPIASPSKPTRKRIAENKVKGKESYKKSKLSNGNEAVSLEEKKSPINRLWSEDDEVALLKGMIEYKLKKGSDRFTDMADFHEFMKKSLHVDVSKSQFMDKIRKMKKKYQINAEKGEKGEGPVFSKAHDQKSFELSKRIWGSRDGVAVDINAKSSNKKATKRIEVKDSAAKDDGKGPSLQEGLKGLVDNKIKNDNKRAKRNVEIKRSMSLPKENGKKLALREGVQDGVSKDLKIDQEGVQDGVSKDLNVGQEGLQDGVSKDLIIDQEEVQDGVSKDLKIDQEGFWCRYPRLKESVDLDDSGFFSEAGKNIMKEEMSRIGIVKAKELEEKWKNFRVGEVELQLQRLDLIREQTKLMLDAMKSSKS